LGRCPFENTASDRVIGAVFSLVDDLARDCFGKGKAHAEKEGQDFTEYHRGEGPYRA
jgi:hypothetical protein